MSVCGRNTAAHSHTRSLHAYFRIVSIRSSSNSCTFSVAHGTPCFNQGLPGKSAISSLLASTVVPTISPTTICCQLVRCIPPHQHAAREACSAKAPRWRACIADHAAGVFEIGFVAAIYASTIHITQPLICNGCCQIFQNHRARRRGFWWMLIMYVQKLNRYSCTILDFEFDFAPACPNAALFGAQAM